jgi:hypothetical protein
MDDVYNQIFNHLNNCSLNNISKTCKRFNRITKYLFKYNQHALFYYLSQNNEQLIMYILSYLKLDYENISRAIKLAVRFCDVNIINYLFDNYQFTQRTINTLFKISLQIKNSKIHNLIKSKYEVRYHKSWYLYVNHWNKIRTHDWKSIKILSKLRRHNEIIQIINSGNHDRYIVYLINCGNVMNFDFNKLNKEILYLCAKGATKLTTYKIVKSVNFNIIEYFEKHRSNYKNIIEYSNVSKDVLIKILKCVRINKNKDKILINYLLMKIGYINFSVIKALIKNYPKRFKGLFFKCFNRILLTKEEINILLLVAQRTCYNSDIHLFFKSQSSVDIDKEFYEYCINIIKLIGYRRLSLHVPWYKEIHMRHLDYMIEKSCDINCRLYNDLLIRLCIKHEDISVLNDLGFVIDFDVLSGNDGVFHELSKCIMRDFRSK